MAQDDRKKGDTWPKVLRHNGEVYGDRRRAMRHKRLGVWEPLTWAAYHRQVQHLSLGLLRLGMAPGDRVLIIGDHAPSWYVAALAVQANRGAAVGLFADATPAEIEFVARDCGARLAVIDGEEQADKLVHVRPALPALGTVVFWSYKGLARRGREGFIGWREALALGEAQAAAHPGLFARNLEEGRPEDVCAVVYTAGTTGQAPKGARHSHRTLRASAEYLLQTDPWTEADNLLPYLPPVWIQEQLIGIGCHLLSGATLNIAEAPETQQRDSRETGPSIVFNRARIWESQAAEVQARIAQADPVKRFAHRRLMPIGFREAESRRRGAPAGPLRRASRKLADVLLFRRIRRSLGLANARICYSSGAILSPEALTFYHALGVPLKSLYGSAEGGALACPPGLEGRPGAVGPPRPDAALAFGPGGEILFRHPGTFLGYCGGPGRPDAAFADGMLPSGDAGSLLADGTLVLAGRLGDRLKTAGGEPLSPELLESRLRFSPYIRDAWVFQAAEAARLAAVFVIHAGHVGKWAGRRRVAFTGLADLSQAPEVIGLIRGEVERINEGLPAGSRIARFVNLDREFDPDEGEMTRTRNLRRAVLRERLRPLVEALQAEAPPEAVAWRAAGAPGRAEGPGGSGLRIAATKGAGA
jgi:long-chain acyl-CoA synthetase